MVEYIYCTLQWFSSILEASIPSWNIENHQKKRSISIQTRWPLHFISYYLFDSSVKQLIVFDNNRSIWWKAIACIVWFFIEFSRFFDIFENCNLLIWTYISYYTSFHACQESYLVTIHRTLYRNMHMFFHSQYLRMNFDM